MGEFSFNVLEIVKRVEELEETLIEKENLINELDEDLCELQLECVKVEEDLEAVEALNEELECDIEKLLEERVEITIGNFEQVTQLKHEILRLETIIKEFR